MLLTASKPESSLWLLLLMPAKATVSFFIIIEGVGTIWKLMYKLPAGPGLVTLECPVCHVPHCWRSHPFMTKVKTADWKTVPSRRPGYDIQEPTALFWVLQSVYTQISLKSLWWLLWNKTGRYRLVTWNFIAITRVFSAASEELLEI